MSDSTTIGVRFTAEGIETTARQLENAAQSVERLESGAVGLRRHMGELNATIQQSGRSSGLKSLAEDTKSVYAAMAKTSAVSEFNRALDSMQGKSATTSKYISQFKNTLKSLQSAFDTALSRPTSTKALDTLNASIKQTEAAMGTLFSRRHASRKFILNDQEVLQLGTRMRDLSQIAQSTSVHLNSVSNAFKSKPATSFITASELDRMSQMTTRATELKSTLHGIRETANTTTAALTQFTSSISLGFNPKPVALLNQGILKIRESLNTLKGLVSPKEFTAFSREGIKNINALETKIKEFSNVTFKYLTSSNLMASVKQMNSITAQATQSNSMGNAISSSFKDLKTDSVDKLRNRLTTLTNSLEVLKIAQQSGLISAGEFRTAQVKTSAEVDKLNATIRNLKSTTSGFSLGEMESAFRRFGGKAQSEYTRQFNLLEKQYKAVRNELRSPVKISLLDASYKRQLLELNEAMGKIGDTSRKAGGGKGGLLSGLIGDKGIGGIFVSTSVYSAAYKVLDLILSLPLKAVAATAAMDKFRASFKGVFGSESVAQMEYVIATADKFGKSFIEIGDGYKKFAAATDFVGLSADKTKSIFESVTAAISKIGGSTADVQGSLTAITQMLSKGTVSSEEFRLQFAERIPGAMKMGADAMGVTVAAFKDLMKSGELSSLEFIPRLASQLNKFSVGWEASTNTIEANSARAKNSLIKLFDSKAMAGLINASLRLFTSFADKLANISDYFGKMADHMDGLGAALVGVKRAQESGGGAEAYAASNKYATSTAEEQYTKASNASAENRAYEKSILSSIEAKAKLRDKFDSLGQDGLSDSIQDDIDELEKTLSAIRDAQARLTTEIEKTYDGKVLANLRRQLIEVGKDFDEAIRTGSSRSDEFRAKLEGLYNEARKLDTTFTVTFDVVVNGYDIAMQKFNTLMKTSTVTKHRELESDIASLQKVRVDAQKEIEAISQNTPQSWYNPDDYKMIGDLTQKIEDSKSAEIEMSRELIDLEEKKAGLTEESLKFAREFPKARGTSFKDKTLQLDYINAKFKAKESELTALFSGRGDEAGMTRALKDLETERVAEIKALSEKGKSGAKSAAIMENAYVKFSQKLKDEVEILKSSLEGDYIQQELDKINKAFNATASDIEKQGIKGKNRQPLFDLAKEKKSLSELAVYKQELDKLFPANQHLLAAQTLIKNFDDLAEAAEKYGVSLSYLKAKMDQLNDSSQLDWLKEQREATTDVGEAYRLLMQEIEIETKDSGEVERGVWRDTLEEFKDTSLQYVESRVAAYDKIIEAAKEAGNVELEQSAQLGKDGVVSSYKKKQLERSRDTATDFGTYAKAQHDLDKGYYKSPIEQQRDEWEKAYKEMESIFDEFSSDVSAGMVDLIVSFSSSTDDLGSVWENLLSSMHSMFKNWASSIVESLVSKNLLEPAKNMIFGALSKGTSALAAQPGEQSSTPSSGGVDYSKLGSVAQSLIPGLSGGGAEGQQTAMMTVNAGTVVINGGMGADLFGGMQTEDSEGGTNYGGMASSGLSLVSSVTSMFSKGGSSNETKQPQASKTETVDMSSINQSMEQTQGQVEQMGDQSAQMAGAAMGVAATVAAFIPVWGQIAGAALAIGGAILTASAESETEKTKSVIGSGTSIGFSGGYAIASGYDLMDDGSKEYKSIDPGKIEELNEAFDDLIRQIQDAVDVFQYDVNVKSLSSDFSAMPMDVPDDLAPYLEKQLYENMTREVIGDFSDAVTRFSEAGEYLYETLIRLAETLTSTIDAADYLGFSLENAANITAEDRYDVAAYVDPQSDITDFINNSGSWDDSDIAEQWETLNDAITDSLMGVTDAGDALTKTVDEINTYMEEYRDQIELLLMADYGEMLIDAVGSAEQVTAAFTNLAEATLTESERADVGIEFYTDKLSELFEDAPGMFAGMFDTSDLESFWAIFSEATKHPLPPSIFAFFEEASTYAANVDELQESLDDFNLTVKEFTADIDARNARVNGMEKEADLIERLVEYEQELTDAREAGLSTALQIQLLTTQIRELGQMAYSVIGIASEATGYTAAFDSFNSALQDMIQNVSEAQSEAESSAESYRNQADAIRDVIEELTVSDLSDLNPDQKMKEYVANYSKLLEDALIGDIDALGDISSVAKDMISSAQDSYTSPTEYGYLLAKTKAELGTAAGAAETTASIQQLQADILQNQLDLLGDIYESLNSGNPNLEFIDKGVELVGVFDSMVGSLSNILLDFDAASIFTEDFQKNMLLFQEDMVRTLIEELDSPTRYNWVESVVKDAAYEAAYNSSGEKIASHYTSESIAPYAAGDIVNGQTIADVSQGYELIQHSEISTLSSTLLGSMISGLNAVQAFHEESELLAEDSVYAMKSVRILADASTTLLSRMQDSLETDITEFSRFILDSEGNLPSNYLDSITSNYENIAYSTINLMDLTANALSEMHNIPSDADDFVNAINGMTTKASEFSQIFSTLISGNLDTTTADQVNTYFNTIAAVIFEFANVVASGVESLGAVFMDADAYKNLYNGTIGPGGSLDTYISGAFDSGKFDSETTAMVIASQLILGELFEVASTSNLLAESLYKTQQAVDGGSDSSIYENIKATMGNTQNASVYSEIVATSYSRINGGLVNGVLAYTDVTTTNANSMANRSGFVAESFAAINGGLVNGILAFTNTTKTHTDSMSNRSGLVSDSFAAINGGLVNGVLASTYVAKKNTDGMANRSGIVSDSFAAINGGLVNGILAFTNSTKKNADGMATRSGLVSGSFAAINGGLVNGILAFTNSTKNNTDSMANRSSAVAKSFSAINGGLVNGILAFTNSTRKNTDSMANRSSAVAGSFSAINGGLVNGILAFTNKTITNSSEMLKNSGIVAGSFSAINGGLVNGILAFTNSTRKNTDSMANRSSAVAKSFGSVNASLSTDGTGINARLALIRNYLGGTSLDTEGIMGGMATLKKILGSSTVVGGAAGLLDYFTGTGPGSMLENLKNGVNASGTYLSNAFDLYSTAAQTYYALIDKGITDVKDKLSALKTTDYLKSSDLSTIENTLNSMDGYLKTQLALEKLTYKRDILKEQLSSKSMMALMASVSGVPSVASLFIEERNAIQASVDALTQRINALGGYATGGVVTSHQIVHVAENGPEAIIPLQNGAVPVNMMAPPSQNNDDLLAEIRELRKENKELQQMIVDNTRATAHWTYKTNNQLVRDAAEVVV